MDELGLARLVRPRVLDATSGGSEPVLLEDALELRLARRDYGPLLLEGRPGAGKRTALEYLRARFAGRPEVAIEPCAGERAAGGLQVVTEYRGESVLPRDRRLALAPWTRDEWIEYLLACHRDACASVMARLEQPEKHLELQGGPLLWTVILDELARDPRTPDALSALRSALRARCSGERSFARACALHVRCLQPLERDAPGEMRRLGADEPALAPFLALDGVRILLAAEGVVQLLARQAEQARALERAKLVEAYRSFAELPRRSPQALLRVAGPLLRERPEVRPVLGLLLEHGPRERQATAAALLHRYGATALAECLRPIAERGAKLPRLNGAQLPGLEAPGLALPRVHLADARVVLAQLDGIDLSGAHLARADLGGASLRGARLDGARAQGTGFSSADLRGAALDGAHCLNARLDEARLEGASLRQARLEGADLRGAILDRADLRAVVLRGARVERASFVEADLSGAILDGVDLRAANLATGKLAGISLAGAHLEGLALEAPDLSGADLADSLLTGTRFTRANLRGARLAGAGLAQIEWEGADLREADLTHASFHLGSTRSGLVLHAPASWGTRTGFYTDELREQGHRSPKEIRKADLRHADLRGARIDDADFYLVDLRGALVTPEQEKHLRECGAILADPR